MLDCATHVLALVCPRYWEDAEVNSVEDTDGTMIPFRDQEKWRLRIELATGLVPDWPPGMTARIHYKVCDAGEYWLTDADGALLAKWSGHYVPGSFFCHGDQGYGDYIILEIGPDGMIRHYDRPEILAEHWDPVDRAPDAISAALRDVIEERQRQVAEEGWTTKHDDAHDKGQLSDAACCYLLHANRPTGLARDTIKLVFTSLWPWRSEWWKPTTRRRDLVKAAALTLAEIERLDRETGRRDGGRHAAQEEQTQGATGSTAHDPAPATVQPDA